jgi:glycopeptide antibiotics resistance protein
MTLTWLVLFKFSVHISSVLHYDRRSLNLVPFAGSSGDSGESVDNVAVFIPFGALLSVSFERLHFWPKLLIVLGASIAAESVQYVFAIGVTDVTDVMTNTLGGLIGLAGYDLCARYVDREVLNRVIVVTGVIVLGCCLALLAAVEVHHGVRYHRPG